MVIAVVNEKGGVGKTTLAVHLAVWLQCHGRHVAFLDADGQGSSSRWLAGAAPQMRLIRELSADGIMEHLRALGSRYDVVVADGPANLAEGTRALLLVADLAVLPCGVSLPELEATADTVRIMRNAQAVRGGNAPRGLVVLNRLRSDRFHLTREAPEAAATLGLRVATSRVRLREVLADSPGQRSVVWRMGRRARDASAEMTELMEEILADGERSTIDKPGVDAGAGAIPTGRSAAIR